MKKRYTLNGTPATPRAPREGKRPRHHISKAQCKWYWKEWGHVRRALRALGLPPDEADEMRHEIHEKALGTDKSHQDFSNRDLDLVLGAFWAITKPGDMNAQLHAENGHKRRLQYGINELDKANPGYTPKILEDAAYSRDWRRLSDPAELTKLRATLARRIGEKSKHAKEQAALTRVARGSDEPQPNEPSSEQVHGRCDGCGAETAVTEQTGHGDRAEDMTGFYLCPACLAAPALTPF